MRGSHNRKSEGPAEKAWTITTAPFLPSPRVQTAVQQVGDPQHRRRATRDATWTRCGCVGVPRTAAHPAVCPGISLLVDSAVPSLTCPMSLRRDHRAREALSVGSSSEWRITGAADLHLWARCPLGEPRHNRVSACGWRDYRGAGYPPCPSSLEAQVRLGATEAAATEWRWQ